MFSTPTIHQDIVANRGKCYNQADAIRHRLTSIVAPMSKKYLAAADGYSKNIDSFGMNEQSIAQLKIG